MPSSTDVMHLGFLHLITLWISLGRPMAFFSAMTPSLMTFTVILWSIKPKISVLIKKAESDGQDEIKQFLLEMSEYANYVLVVGDEFILF